METEPDTIALSDVKQTWRENIKGTFVMWRALLLGSALPIAIFSMSDGVYIPHSIVGRLVFFVIAAVAAPTLALLVWFVVALAFWPWTRNARVSRSITEAD